MHKGEANVDAAELKDQIAILVHDARNPLNRISMQAELAKMMIEQGASGPQTLEALDKILTGCQDCSHQLEKMSQLAGS